MTCQLAGLGNQRPRAGGSLHFATKPLQNALPVGATNGCAPRIRFGTKSAERLTRMQEALYQKPPHSGTMASFNPTFRLFIACEDQAAFLQAKKVQEQIEALFGNEFEISRGLWNFALLRHERLREYAVMEAAEAEIIVISFRASSELPPHVKCWMESLPARTQIGQAALVALLGPKQLSREARHPQIAYLRQIAEGRGLDFFCNQEGPDRLDFSPPVFRSMDGITVERSFIFHHIPGNAGRH